MFDVVVTGAEGFIGHSLVARLRTLGYSVYGMSRSSGNLVTQTAWEQVPAARHLVHLAGRSYVPDSWADPSAFLETNVIATQRAVTWCQKHQARMVIASAYIYGIPERLPISEHDTVRPNNPYALSKYLSEQCCQFAHEQLGIDVTVLRLFNVFGHNQRSDFLIPMLINQLKGQEIRVKDLLPRRDYVYLDDVVDAFTCALNAPQGFHVLNVGSGRSFSVAQIIETLQKVADTKLPVITEKIPRQSEIPDVVANISMAEKVLGWRPKFDLAAGLANILNGVNHG